MPPQKRAPCQVCREKESKYTCAKCMVLYCSIDCFKAHKGERQARPSSAVHLHDKAQRLTDPTRENTAAPPLPEDTRSITPPPVLRPLTSLNWPYAPEESAFPDPLKRDDPKPLQLHQYEAVATSPAVRRILAAHPRLKDILRRIDARRGPEREDALQRALGITHVPAALHAPQLDRGLLELGAQSEEDTRALRELAEAVEGAVRGGKEGALGLDWGD
ncbi:hypothetical protein OBBRIDRAFT_734064 [Obba rivulosa]|uniref:HIT-type domain-containing protein n=1 Tax=Obba rivulosa TaxID=1052685 RepID=A0A8E2AV20_9APHY|nr:hypothetical protein OBBRIDRAFT_734064 [Obba rivulosa]